MRYIIGTLSLLVLIAAVITYNLINHYTSQAFCRSIPGDPDWPQATDWARLNETVGGRLIATVPIGAVCHRSYNGYDKEACDRLRDNWFFATTHLDSPSSPMAYSFTNNSCNPFDRPDSSCTVGSHSAYTVNATTVADIQAALRFVTKHNVRLVIRNSGHDYLGKSTGAHSLSIWTHYMKSMELIKTYRDSSYQGPAIKVGAGVEGGELYSFAGSHGLMAVAGNCPNVGVAGGYTQGGGIGILSSKFGLAADQVLSWDVVLASGKLVTASPTEEPDLFWALRGGGGGTYGVVVSMTIRAFPDTFFSTANLAVMDDGTKTDAIYSTIGTFLQHSLPALVDAGAWVVFVAASFGFLIMPVMLAGVKSAVLDEYLTPTLDKMDQLGLKRQYTYTSTEHPDFLTAYRSMPATWNVSDYNPGGRLIPRDAVKDSPSTESLVSAIRHITTKGAIFSGVGFNVTNAVPFPDAVAANPYFRRTLFSAVIGEPVNYTDWAGNRAAQDKITHELLPALQAITPDGAVYLNEADFQDPDFKNSFYGPHYQQLLEIKRRYDPDHVFYARTAVGSDFWRQGSDGRLCMV